MSVKETKLNNVQVEVLKAPVEFTKKNVLGWNYLQNPWSNVLFCSKKNSGKTTVIYNLVKNIIDKRTKVFIFSGSVYADSVYKELIKYCKNKEIPCKAYPHFIDNGINLIEQLVKGLGDTPVSDTTINKDEHASLIFDKDDDRPKRRKKKKIVPEILIICDDLGSSLRAQAISTLCKTNRHNKLLNLFSFHVKSDILPSTCQQADFLFLF